ncbi:unnamed protein product [Mytilus edulis]|uniref:COR domain-containing protein n=1 Tax=Mytilus edulis TaxID=6550 RepID=A0A8S3U2X9_MYTED|nr:unnamed protein product [Mytilus edulis]
MIKTLNHEKEKTKRNNPKNKAETSFSGTTETDENEETVILKESTKSTAHSQETQPKMNYALDIPQTTEISLSKHERELSSIIKSDIDLQDDDNYAMLTVWDFAGDIEYYNTHQTFLNPDAIYLVVASLHDIDDTDSYGPFNFWMDTIHCYGNVADKNEGLLQSDGTDHLLDPPVIAIGTHKDKFQDENQCRERLASYTDTIFKDSKLHLRSTHLLSNTNDKEQTFRKLRKEIFTTASNSQNWNREYPVKFLQLEKAINSESKQIIPFDRVKELGANISIPITDNKELRLFLRFQHEVGNLIYYEDIPSYIILDPQWLVNAFKCIVTAKQFQLKLPHLQWEELKQTGKMDKKLLDAILQKQSTEMICPFIKNIF